MFDMAITISLLSLIVALAALQGAILKTMDLQRQIDELEFSQKCQMVSGKDIVSRISNDAMFVQTPESETVGSRITTKEEFYAMLRNLDVLEKQNNGLPEFKAPPPPMKPKKPINEY